MKKGLRISLIFAFCAAFVLLPGCNSNLCENKLINAVDSPDHKLKAVLFERDCGATTGFNRQVALLNQSDALPKNSDVDSFFAVSGQPTVSVVWLSSSEIEVRYGAESRVIRSDTTNRSVSVKYKVNP